jgi:hypothetical protein
MEAPTLPGGGTSTESTERFSVDHGDLEALASALRMYAKTFQEQAAYSEQYLKCAEAFPFYSEDLWPVYEQSADAEKRILTDMGTAMADLAKRVTTAGNRYLETERRHSELLSEIERMLEADLPPYVAGEFERVGSA